MYSMHNIGLVDTHLSSMRITNVMAKQMMDKMLQNLLVASSSGDDYKICFFLNHSDTMIFELLLKLTV